LEIYFYISILLAAFLRLDKNFYCKFILQIDKLQNSFRLVFFKIEEFFKFETERLEDRRLDAQAHNMGFCYIGAGRCNFHHQQYGSSCSGRTSNDGLLVVILYICFQSAAVPGLTFFKSPNIAKPYRCMPF